MSQSISLSRRKFVRVKSIITLLQVVLIEARNQSANFRLILNIGSIHSTNVGPADQIQT